MEFLRLQEQTAKATEQWLVANVRVAQLQQRNVRFAQDWLRDGAEAVREQAEHNLRTVEAFARGVAKQREGLRAFARTWADAHRDFLSPSRTSRKV
jgi:hypothetical protein